MKDLLDAIYTKYNLVDAGVFAALRAANTGGLRLAMHTTGAAYPYMVYTTVTNTVEYTMSSYIKDSTIQFSIFDDTFATVMTVYNALCTAFDDTVLTYDNDTAIVMQRVSETGPTLDEKTYMVTVDYQVIRQIAR